MTSRLILLWVGFLVLHLASLLFPHRQYSAVGSVNFGLQFLLFLLCVRMAWKDVRTFKPAFINLAILFAYSVPLYLSIFVGTVLFKDQPYASLYYHQYINKIGYNVILAIAVAYLLLDYRFPMWRVLAKYAVAFSITAGIALPLYYPYLKDSLHLYRTADYSRFLDLADARQALSKMTARVPQESEVIQLALDTISKREGLTSPEALSKERAYFG